MPEPALSIHPVDFADPQEVRHYLDLLDNYSRDPMGAGRPLEAAVRERLAASLLRD